MTLVASYHLSCDTCSSLIKLANPRFPVPLLEHAAASGWDLREPADPFADRVDLCPRCRQQEVA